MTSPALSVVVPAHDAAATLGAQLDALLAQDSDRPFEVIVVDNRSTDGTAALVAARARADARVRLVAAPAGAGPSHARNTGARAAAAPLVACCDADDVVAPGWIAAMAAALADHPYVAGALDVDLLNPAEVVEARGRAVTRGPGELGGLTFAHGCNFGIDRELFLAAGGFDERLHAGEEIDLALRLRARGVTVRYAPDAVVRYRYRTGARDQWRQAYAYGRVRPDLVRRLRAAGIAVRRRDGWRQWIWLLRALPGVRGRAGRLRWLWVAGFRCGHLAGAAPRRAVATRPRTVAPGGTAGYHARPPGAGHGAGR